MASDTKMPANEATSGAGKDVAFDATQELFATNKASEEERRTSTAPLIWHAGMLVKHYEIIRTLGEGGMGTVYLARDTRLGRLVAIKLLLEHSGPAAERFLVEARTTARCRHENIVVIYDVDELDGYPYMVLEYIEGQNLRHLTVSAEEEGALGVQRNPTSLALELMLPVVRALVCAHEMGIVHRDLKPENILLANSGVVRVVDFGIAKQVAPDLGTAKNLALALPASDVRMTQDGAIVGTMPYMSPEQWLSEPLDARTDIWAVGIMLFELLTGKHPLGRLTLAALATVIDFDTPMPSVADKRPDVGPLADIVERCLKKRKEERYSSSRELLSALVALSTMTRPESDVSTRSEEASPYAGLSAFQEADASRFFGRESDIAAAVGKLRNQELIAIAGPSGAGKSSFVRAGLIPALKRSGRNLEAFLVRPGLRPLAALSDLLASLENQPGGPASVDADGFSKSLHAAPGILGARLRARCREQGEQHRILLFVDQLEELYTLGIDPEERAAFCASIEGVADDASSPLRVVLTVRADFLDRMSDDRRFMSAVTRGLIFLPPIGQESLREALERPLSALQYKFEDDNLVSEMLLGLSGAKSPLPLLQFTATKLWEARDREKRLLTRESYRALGGVAGALSTHADAVLSGLSPREQRLARSIFVRLVTPERTRAIVPWDELCAIDVDRAKVAHIIERLAEARILSIVTGGDGEERSVELLHESLIERWSKLRSWLDEDQQDAQFLAELRNASQQWEKNGEADGFLWRDAAALSAGQWLERRQKSVGDAGGLGLGGREERYLEAVVRLSQRTRRWRRNLAIAIGAAAMVVAFVVSVLAVRAREQAGRAEIARKKAEMAEADAKEKTIEALDARLLAGARELLGQHNYGSAAHLLFDVQRPAEARGYEALANDALFTGSTPYALKDANQGMLEVREIGRESLLVGHTKALTVATWSHDGKRVLTAAADGTARIWSASGDGDPLVLNAKRGAVLHALWSPDDQRVLTTTQDGSTLVWSLDGRGSFEEFSGAGSAVTAAAWSAQGDQMAVATADQKIHVWRMDGEGRQKVDLTGHTGIITHLAFLPDGKRLLSSSKDTTARLWPLDGGEALRVFQEHTAPIRFLEPSPDGSKFVTASDDKTARIWDVGGKEKPVVLAGHDAAVIFAAWSPDGSHIATGSLDKTARVWALSGPATPVVLAVDRGATRNVSWSPDGRYLAIATQDGSSLVWPARGGTLLVLVEQNGPVLSASFSPDGRRVLTALAERDDGRLGEFTASIFRVDRLFSLRKEQGYNHSASFDAKAEFLVSAYDDRTARVSRIDGSLEPVVIAGHSGWVANAALSPDGSAIVSASFDKTARVSRVVGKEEPVVLAGHTAAVRAAVWSPDGSFIVTASDDKTALVFASNGKGESRRLSGHTDGLTSAAVSPDGGRVVTTSRDHTARVWKLEGTEEPVVLRGHTGSVVAAVWSADGKRIATASEDQTARVWDAETGAELVVLEHDEGVRHLVFAPDGQRLATSTQHQISLFRADGAGEPTRLVMRKPVLALSFVNDGRELLVAGPNQFLTTFVVDVALSKERLRASNTECLSVSMRSTYLGESDRLAQERYAACERDHARTPFLTEEVSP